MHTLTEKKKAIIDRLFVYIEDGWEVYIPLQGDNKFILLKTICFNCGYDWHIDEKECFFCKFRYIRAVKCASCNEILPEENLGLKCPKCRNIVKNKGCLNCGRSEEGQYVPITFCIKCGARRSKFKIQVVDFS